MLNSKGFDLWANDYDKDVQLSEESNSYPFAGYQQVLGTIYRTIRENPGKRVLDIGFGTGVLTRKLYADGYEISGMDFSEQMLSIARAKMPEADLIRHDFSQGFPEYFGSKTFDFMVCTYAIHHLDTPQKAAFIRELTPHLSENGLLLIGDVAFRTETELSECRAACGDSWDEDEIYMVEETLKPLVPNLEYEKITFCSGVFTVLW